MKPISAMMDLKPFSGHPETAIKEGETSRNENSIPSMRWQGERKIAFREHYIVNILISAHTTAMFSPLRKTRDRWQFLASHGRQRTIYLTVPSCHRDTDSSLSILCNDRTGRPGTWNNSWFP